MPIIGNNYISPAEIDATYKREQEFERQVIDAQERIYQMSDAELERRIDPRRHGDPARHELFRRRNVAAAAKLKIGDSVSALIPYGRSFYHGAADVVEVGHQTVTLQYMSGDGVQRSNKIEARLVDKL